MKVLLHYEDNESPELHKTLKITLPKSWKTGPTSKLLGQFVESYNANETLGKANPLSEADLHLAIRENKLKPLASDAVVVDCIADRADVYVLHGPSKTVEEMNAQAKESQAQQDEFRKNTVPCTRFGCKNRFPKEGPYPDCRWHKAPPVFHETAKFWSCCPQKKAYDWDTFQSIPGCETGKCCTPIKEMDTMQFLGGTDLREQINGDAPKLRSIEDFNKAEAAGGAAAAPVLDRCRGVMEELGIEKELFQQVVDRMTTIQQEAGLSGPELLEAVKTDLGDKLKKAFQSIAAEQMRVS